MAGIRNADVGQQVNVPIEFTDAQANNGFVGLREGVQTIALGGVDTTLILAGEAGAGEVRLYSNIIRVDPGGNGTKLILPAVADLSGIGIKVYNSADAAEELLLRNSGDSATVIALDQGESGHVDSDGTSYFALGGSSGGGTDFGAGGLSADVISESTAAAGVTVDGLLVKDGGLTLPSAGVLSLLGSGTVAGSVVQRVGKTATEGLELVVFEQTLAPAAIETAVLTIPANSIVMAAQANVQTALTGGGTTDSFGIGTAADPDKYGSSATLTLDSKLDFIGPVQLTSSEAVVLTGTAGQTADGNTALTVGTVRIRIVYYTLNSLDNA